MPCQSLDWTDSSLSSRGIRLHLPLNTEWCSPGFSNADCTSIIWWSAPGNPWAHKALNRGRMWAANETAPTRQPPPPFQTFRRWFLHFVKPAFLKSLKWQASFPKNKSFQKHFENGTYFHRVFPTEAKQAIFTNLCYCSPGTDWPDFASSWMVQNGQSLREGN